MYVPDGGTPPADDADINRAPSPLNSSKIEFLRVFCGSYLSESSLKPCCCGSSWYFGWRCLGCGQPWRGSVHQLSQPIAEEAWRIEEAAGS